jgi:hypothetical protein
VYHEPFKDTCIESEIIIGDCNKHAQTSESTISYKHVNFCGVLRPCEKNQDITNLHSRRGYQSTQQNAVKSVEVTL